MGSKISIVIPVYNEQENILPLTREVQAAVKPLAMDYEVIFVDDASSDATWSKIASAAKIEPRVRGLRHCKNSGQSAALWTGLRHSKGDIIGTMDGDLQNDPADFPKMIEALKEADFVCGVRARRKDSWLRRVSSKIARRARKAALGIDFCDTGCAMRVFRRDLVENFFAFNGMHRFLPILAHNLGARTVEIPVNHRPRVAGVSKYGLWNRLGRGIFDLFAMAWYQKRRIGKIVCSELESGSQPSPFSN